MISFLKLELKLDCSHWRCIYATILLSWGTVILFYKVIAYQRVLKKLLYLFLSAKLGWRNVLHSGSLNRISAHPEKKKSGWLNIDRFWFINDKNISGLNENMHWKSIGGVSTPEVMRSWHHLLCVWSCVWSFYGYPLLTLFARLIFFFTCHQNCFFFQYC